MGSLFSWLCLGLNWAFHGLMRRYYAQAPEGSPNYPSLSALRSYCSSGFSPASLSSQSLIPHSSVSDSRAQSAPSYPSPFLALPPLGPKRKGQSLPTRSPSSSGVLPFLGWDPSELYPDYSAKNIPPPTPKPPVLSAEVVVLGDEAMSKLETIRPRQILKRPELSLHPAKNRLQTVADESLQDYFSAAIDAKNALLLRKAAVVVDIGQALQALRPCLSLYDRDAAVLCTVAEEIQEIEDECLRRELMLNFYALERLRSLVPPYQQSVIEEHSSLFSAVGVMIEECNDACIVAQRFFNDPSALREHCLPHSRTMVR